MTKDDFFNYPGFIIAISVFFAGFILIVRDTGEWIGSFSAALMLAGIVWISYVIIRWMVLAVRK